MYELFVKSAQIGWCPLWFRIYASSEHGRTMFAPTDVCGVIKGCEINNNAKCQGGWAVEGASPYNSEITASPEHGRTLFAPTDVCGIIKGCEINNNAKCQRGVGCRGRQPLHLIAMVCYAAKSLRSVLFFYFMLVLFFGQLCSFLIPHSSFLIPHSSFLTLLALPLDETTVK